MSGKSGFGKWRALGVALAVLMVAPVWSAPMGTAFSYQGQLKRAGAPATGNFDFRFKLYDAVSGGAQVGADVLRPAVGVSNGLFTANLDFGAMAFGGAARFLQIEVKPAGGGAYTLLTPRQELKPTPYALYASSVGGHSHFANYWIGVTSAYGLDVDNSGGTGDGIRGYSGATAYNYAGLYGVCTSTGSGVFGHSQGGAGVYGESDTGDGLEGLAQTAGKSGVYGHSGPGFGVTGRSDATDGVVGWTNDAGHSGVYGNSVGGFGVTGRSTSNTAVAGISTNGYGVYGESSGSDLTGGWGGYFVSNNYRGLYAKGGAAWYAAYFESPGGSGGAGLYVNGTLWVTGSKTGYVVDLALNDGPEPLETGDVVVITGNGAPVSGEIPVVKVRKCGAAGSSGVVGIVDQPMSIKATQAAPSNRQEDLPRPSGKTAAATDGTAVGTGQYVTVVTLGSFKTVKVDASGGAIKPGDLLVASPNAGYAAKSAAPAPGTLIGKSLGELAAGSGTIPVMVTLH